MRKIAYMISIVMKDKFYLGGAWLVDCKYIN